MFYSLWKQDSENLRGFKNSLIKNKFILVGDNFFFKNYFFFKFVYPKLKVINQNRFYLKNFIQKFTVKSFRHPKYFTKKRKSFKNLYKLFKFNNTLSLYTFYRTFINYWRTNLFYTGTPSRRIDFNEVRPYRFLPFFVKHKNPYIHRLLMLPRRQRYAYNSRFKKNQSYRYIIKRYKLFSLKMNLVYRFNHIIWNTRSIIPKRSKKDISAIIKYQYYHPNISNHFRYSIGYVDSRDRNTNILINKNIVLNETLGLVHYKNNIKPKLYTQPNFAHSKNCFIFNNGLFLMFMFNFQIQTQNNFNFKFRWKKRLYSFLKPNEYRKSIFLKKRKSLISHFFLKFKKRLYYYNSIRFSYSKILLKFREFFLTSTPNIPFYKETTYNSILYKYSIEGKEDMHRHGEVKIPRIRFKPGYQRIWRRARFAIKELLNLKYVYQYRLTRYLTKFSRFLGTYSIFTSDFSIKRILLYSRLLPDTSTFTIFLQNKLIYINGLYASTPETLIYVNDVLQLIVSKWYYVFSRWVSNWSLIRLRRFKKLIFRKGSPSRYKLMKQRKTRSIHTPNWIHNIRYEFSDIKPYLEVDFFTLSVVYIYEPNHMNIFPISDIFEQRHFIYRLYNWKYIT